MIPTPGRIVEYTLTEFDCQSITASRKTEGNSASGNFVTPGDTYPMVIVRCWGGQTEGAAVNGQVLLDGTDTFWATSRTGGDGPGQWRPYQRVESGKAKG